MAFFWFISCKMSEIKIEIKTEVNSQKPENSELEQVIRDGKLECPNSIALNAKETTYSENVEASCVKNELQPECAEVQDCFEKEMLSFSSSESSEFTAVSLGSFKDEMENIIICVGNEYAYNHCLDLEKDDLYKRESYNSKKIDSYKEIVRQKYDFESDRNFYLRRIINKNIKPNQRIRQKDDNYKKYSPDKNMSTYYYNNYRCSRSWDRNKSRYISIRSKRSRSGDKNKRYRKSASPPYRSRRRRIHSRSYSRSRSHSCSRSRSRSRSRSCSYKPSPDRSRKRSPSPSSNYSSPKQNLNKRDSSTWKKHLSPNSAPRMVEELLDHLKCPNNWTINCENAKSPAPEPPLFNSQPPLPKSPPPPKPPPPVDSYSGIPPPPITINQVPNVGFPSNLWVNQENHHLQHFYTFQNPPMPRVSVNNLPLVPGVGNLPVHITPTGEQILHDMEGRPIPVGPNGCLLPVDMSGRLVPHVEFMFSNQTVPIYMTEDGVLRLPNGEPVPNNNPNQLPVNIDGSIIPIGPDSRPLYQNPDVPEGSTLISSQGGALAIPNVCPIESQQNIDINSPVDTAVNINTGKKTNLISDKRFKKVKPSPAIIEIQPVSDLEFKNKQISSENLEIEMKVNRKEGLKICEEPAATNTQSAADIEKPNRTVTECSVVIPKENNKVLKRKLYENVDLNKLVEKFSDRVSSRKIRTIYQKKIKRNLNENKGPGTEACVAKEDLAFTHKCDANLEEKSHLTIQSENYFVASDENLSDCKKDYGLSDEEAFGEKVFTEAINEAISLFADIDFNPPALGRFLFSKSPTYSVNQSPPNASPLLRNKVKLPFLSPENFDSPPRKKKSSNVNFRFLPEKDGKLLDKATPPSVRSSSAVQCDFTSRKFQSLCAQIDILKKKLSRCETENAELKDLHKSLQEENRKKTGELNRVMKIIEEKNKLINCLTQPPKQFWK